MADADGNIFGPFDVSVPDSEAEPFTEEAYFRMHDECGVVEGFGLTFTGLTAHLEPGFAYSHGGWLVREDVWDDASPPTVGVDPRRDLLVLRRTLTVGEGDDATPGRVVPVVLRGAPAAGPVNPAHDPETDERLWSWRVPGSGGTVVTVITDHRRYVNRDGSPIIAAEAPVMKIGGVGTQSITPSTTNKVLLPLAVIAGGPFTAIDNEIRCDMAGIVDVSGIATWPTGTAVVPDRAYATHVLLNGVAVAGSGRSDPATNNTLNIPTAAIPLEVGVGDRIALGVTQITGANKNVLRNSCFLAARYLGPVPA